jgi:hypothetical protein
MSKPKSAARFPRNTEADADSEVPLVGAADSSISVETSPAPSKRGSKYPWDKLEVSEVNEDGSLTGQSFFLPGKTKKQFAGPAYVAAKKFGKKFTVRQMTKNGVDGVGIWRTE